MKRCEWVSGLDLIDFAIGFEVQVSVEQLSCIAHTSVL
jgi:hypothetical protein